MCGVSLRVPTKMKNRPSRTERLFSTIVLDAGGISADLWVNTFGAIYPKWAAGAGVRRGRSSLGAPNHQYNTPYQNTPVANFRPNLAAFRADSDGPPANWSTQSECFQNRCGAVCIILWILSPRRFGSLLFISFSPGTFPFRFRFRVRKETDSDSDSDQLQSLFRQHPKRNGGKSIYAHMPGALAENRELRVQRGQPAHPGEWRVKSTKERQLDPLLIGCRRVGWWLFRNWRN